MKKYCKNCKYYTGIVKWVKLVGRAYKARICKNKKAPDIKYTPCFCYKRKWYKFWVK